MIFADKPEKAKLLLEGVENKLTPCLKIIVIMDSYDNDLVERGRKCGVEIIGLKALEVSESWHTAHFSGGLNVVPNDTVIPVLLSHVKDTGQSPQLPTGPRSGLCAKSCSWVYFAWPHF